jgi:tetratricopeptide (TPR) repeat protein
LAHAPQTSPARERPAQLSERLVEIALAYQQILAQNPHQPVALAGMSVVALVSRQPEAAVRMASAAVEAAPHMVNAWVALGQALKSAYRNEEAERAYREAIRHDGVNPLARLGLGELQLLSGHPEQALAEFELALRRQPALVPAHMGMGNAMAFLGRDADALHRYESALGLRTRLPEGEFAAGFVLARLGRVKEAEIRYRRALTQRPDFAAAWMNLGNLLREQGREAHAEAALLRAVELRPDLIGGWLNLAILERERNRPAQAESHLRKALALNPNQVETLIAWCQFRAAEQDLAAAWDWLHRALVRDSNHAEAWNMRGILLHTEGRFADAVVAFEHAESLGHRAAASNRGNSLLDMGQMTVALQAHEKAVERDPTHAGANYNLALTQLRLGDWERGWPAYEARWRFREVHPKPRVFHVPRWNGEALHGRRILLHAEQGLGDTIQFCRYANLVAARGGFPVLQVQQPVERLLRSMPLVQSGVAEVCVLGATIPFFEIECPLLSLPAVFATTVDTVPWTGAYVAADPALVLGKSWQFNDEPRGRQTLRVGVTWAGNPRYKADSQRSMKLETLLPLLRKLGIHWNSLQKGPAADQLATLPADVTVHDGSSRDRDLADTAALIAMLDLVITTDTCIAHLVGAMGRPVWILLPHLSDWRWMQKIETTPWYPTARLFRQSSPGDWDGVLSRVITELGAFPRSLRRQGPPAHPPAAHCEPAA